MAFEGTQSLVDSVEEWLASNAAGTDQAIRDLERGWSPLPLFRTLWSWRRWSVLPGRRRCWRLNEAESRCVKELATLKALREKLMDTELM